MPFFTKIHFFSGEKLNVSWGRVVALYAFGAQLALHCSRQGLPQCQQRISVYLGRYAKEVISSFVHSQGGWVSYTYSVILTKCFNLKKLEKSALFRIQDLFHYSWDVSIPRINWWNFTRPKMRWTDGCGGY